MKKFISGVAAGALALGCMSMIGVVSASADTTTTTTTAAPTTTTTQAPPVQGAAPVALALTVDTVVASGMTGTLAYAYPLAGCAMTNEFLVGQTVVFRMWGNDVSTGGQPLTSANVLSAIITIPGVTTPVAMAYGNHGTAAYWTGAWKTTGYPTMGAVKFSLVVTTYSTPAVTKQVSYQAKVAYQVKVNGKMVTKYHTVTRTKTVVVTPAVPSGSQTYTQTGLPDPLTLNPIA